jgi:hypothetical protein
MDHTYRTSARFPVDKQLMTPQNNRTAIRCTADAYDTPVEFHLFSTLWYMIDMLHHLYGSYIQNFCLMPVGYDVVDDTEE